MELRRFVSAFLLLILGSQSFAVADTPVRQPPISSSVIVVTPQNLNGLLFSGTTDLAKEMNNVLRAKNNVEVAFGNLIPSLNLNLGVLVGSPPLFLLSSVSCLVPFLFPSNWQGYRASQKEAFAEASAFEITKLNAYATAYTLLTRYSNDEQIGAILEEQVQRVADFLKDLQNKPQVGPAAALDLIRGELELRKSRIEMLKFSEAFDAERAAVRKMLGLNVEQVFRVAFDDQTPALLEDRQPTQGMVYQLFNRAPERRQLELLLVAARKRKQAAVWAFLAGCSGSQGSWGPSTSNAFSFSSTLTLSIGYGNFPQISLNQRNVEDLLTRQKELLEELARLLEVAQKSVAEAKRRMQEAVKAVELGENMLVEQTRLLAGGRATPKDLLDTAAGIARARIETLNAKTAIEGHRVTLKRLALEGSFRAVLIKALQLYEGSAILGRSGD